MQKRRLDILTFVVSPYWNSSWSSPQCELVGTSSRLLLWQFCKPWRSQEHHLSRVYCQESIRCKSGKTDGKYLLVCRNRNLAAEMTAIVYKSIKRKSNCKVSCEYHVIIYEMLTKEISFFIISYWRLLWGFISITVSNIFMPSCTASVTTKQAKLGL